MVRAAQALAVAGLTASLSGAASAADYSRPLAPPIVELPPIEDVASGWYLRGDIGMTNQQVGSLNQELFPTTPQHQIVDKNFESGMLFGVGLGYQWNNWLRTDITGEYRGETGFHGLDTWFDGTNARFNNYTAKKSEWLFLANVYADLGTWHNITPFVGVGVGMSRNTIHSFRDTGIDAFGSPTLSFADAESKWNFAWAVHAGLSYRLSSNASLEFAYRYVNLGKGLTGDIVSYDGAQTIGPMHYDNITSHDLKFGVRWMLNDAPAMPSAIELPPLMHRG